jgi:predicted ABC-type ATPase
MARRAATILAAAGTNGAGKSSIVQPFIEARGGTYFNPDEYARGLVRGGIALKEANGLAWIKGYAGLIDAIENNQAYAFETTLGGHSVAYQLMRALAFGRRVVILYVGLSSVELHLQRIRERVARGGHDIPEPKVRERYEASRANLLSFIGTDATVRVWDNSTQTSDGRPESATEIFRVQQRRLVLPEDSDPKDTVAWARPLLAQAVKLGLAKGD